MKYPLAGIHVLGIHQICRAPCSNLSPCTRDSGPTSLSLGGYNTVSLRDRAAIEEKSRRLVPIQRSCHSALTSLVDSSPALVAGHYKRHLSTYLDIPEKAQSLAFGGKGHQVVSMRSVRWCRSQVDSKRVRKRVTEVGRKISLGEKEKEIFNESSSSIDRVLYD